MIAEIEVTEADVKTGTQNLLSSQALLAIRYEVVMCCLMRQIVLSINIPPAMPKQITKDAFLFQPSVCHVEHFLMDRDFHETLWCQ